MLNDLAELLVGFQGMYEGFKQRARATREILAAEDTQFLVVSTPGERGAEGAFTFRARLLERGCRVGGVVLNRSASDPFIAGPGQPDQLAQAVGPALAARLAAAADVAQRTAQRHAASAADIAGKMEDTPVSLVPELPRDIHDLVGLEALRAYMFRPHSGNILAEAGVSRE